MLKQLILAVLLLCGPAFSQETPQQKPETATSDNHTATEPKATTQMPIVVKVVPTPKTETEKEEERHERQEKAELDKKLVDLTAELSRYTGGLYSATVVLAVATIFLVIATFGLVVFAFRQAGDMKASIIANQQAADAAKLAADAAVGVEIPRIFLDDIEFLESGVGNADAKLQRPRVHIGVKNYGRTPAFLDKQAVEMRIGLTLPSKPEYPNTRELDPGTIIEGNAPYANNGLPTARMSNLLSTETVDALRKGQTFIWVYGFIAYRDFLNNGHEMRFCAHYRLREGESDLRGPSRFIFDGPAEYTKSY